MTHLPIYRPTSFAVCEALGLGVHHTETPRPKTTKRAKEEDVDVDLADELDALDAADAPKDEPLPEPPAMPCPFVGCVDHLVWVSLGIEDASKLSQESLELVLTKLEEIDVEAMPITCGRRGPFTLEQVGDLMRVTRERIRQIESKALRKLRHPSRSNGLTTFAKDELPPEKKQDLGVDAALLALSMKAATDNAAKGRAVFTVNGVSKTRNEWAAVLDCDAVQIASSASRKGISFGEEVAIRLKARAAANESITAAGRSQTLAEWAKDLNLRIDYLERVEKLAVSRGETIATWIENRLRRDAARAQSTGQPAAKLYTVGERSLSRRQWAAELGLSEARLFRIEMQARAHGRTIEDEIRTRLEVRAARQVLNGDAPPAVDPAVHTHTVATVFEQTLAGKQTAPGTTVGVVTVDGIALTRSGWAHFFGIRKQAIFSAEANAAARGETIEDEIRRRLVKHRARNAPAKQVAEPQATAAAVTVDDVFERVFAAGAPAVDAAAPAPIEQSDSPDNSLDESPETSPVSTSHEEPTCEHTNSTAGTPADLEDEMKDESDATPPASVSTEDASAPVTLESPTDHVDVVAEIAAAAPELRPRTKPAARVPARAKKRPAAPAARHESPFERAVREAAKGFESIVAGVEKRMRRGH